MTFLRLDFLTSCTIKISIFTGVILLDNCQNIISGGWAVSFKMMHQARVISEKSMRFLFLYVQLQIKYERKRQTKIKRPASLVPKQTGLRYLQDTSQSKTSFYSRPGRIRTSIGDNPSLLKPPGPWDTMIPVDWRAIFCKSVGGSIVPAP